MIDSSDEPTLAEALDVVLREHSSSLRVMLPGIVESYDATTQTADIKPLLPIARHTEEGEVENEEIPVLPSVPVVFPRAGEYFMSFPLKKGHYVMLLFSDRSLDVWRRGNGSSVVDPVMLHTHNVADAVALVGLNPSSEDLADVHVDNIVIGKDGGAQVHIKADQVSLYEENAADYVALAGDVASNLSAIKDELTIIQTGITGAGGVYTPVYIPSAVAATKVKAT